MVTKSLVEVPFLVHGLIFIESVRGPFKCCIETKLRSFYFKIFHKAIPFNDFFLFKINRKASVCHDFCKKKNPEAIIHVFCECDFVKPIWDGLIKIIKEKHDIDFSISNFEKMFGAFKDNFITHLFLCVKYYIYVCKFIGYTTSFQQHFSSFVGMSEQ